MYIYAIIIIIIIIINEKRWQSKTPLNIQGHCCRAGHRTSPKYRGTSRCLWLRWRSRLFECPALATSADNITQHERPEQERQGTQAPLNNSSTTAGQRWTAPTNYSITRFVRSFCQQPGCCKCVPNCTVVRCIGQGTRSEGGGGH